MQKKPEEINTDFITAEIKKLLDIDVSEADINNFYSLGNKENCPLKLEFVSHLKKVSILRNAKKLKGTNISIANDMTTKQREENKILRKHLFIAKQNNNNTCYIKKNQLYINNKIYTAHELKQLEDTDDKISQLQPKSTPETPTNFNIKGVNTIAQPVLQTIANKKTKTLSNTHEGSSSGKKEVKEAAKKTGNEIKEDKVTTRSRR